MVMVYVLDEILSVVASLSCCFQDNNLSIVDVQPLLKYQLRRLEEKFTFHSVTDNGKVTARVPPELSTTIKGLLKVLRERKGLWNGVQLHSADGNWEVFTDINFKQWGYFHHISKDLFANLRERFPPEDLSIAAAFSVFSPRRLALVDEREMNEYGIEEIQQLGEFFGEARGGFEALVDVSGLMLQWDNSVRMLVTEAKAEVARAKAKGGAAGQQSVGARPFWKGMLSFMEVGSPDVATLVLIMLVMQPASAQVERGFSAMNLIKSKQRTSLAMKTLDALMRVTCNGPTIALAGQSKDKAPWKEFDELIVPSVVQKWHNKSRNAACSSHATRPNRVKQHNAQDME